MCFMYFASTRKATLQAFKWQVLTENEQAGPAEELDACGCGDQTLWQCL